MASQPAPASEAASDRTGTALGVSDLSAAWSRTGPAAIEQLSLEVPFGSTVAVLGPNGSGKSSLFSVIVGLLEPRAGEVEVGARRVAWLPQELHLSPSFPATVADVVAMGRWGRGRWTGRLRSADRRRIDAAMDRLAISDLACDSIHELSGGQRQRALIAQVVAMDADLILLDEPLTGVDSPTADVIAGLIAEWRTDGRAVLVATHDLEAAATDHDLVLALNRKMIAFGPAAEVCTEPILRETFSGHVVRLGDEVVDTSHQHPGAA